MLGKNLYNAFLNYTSYDDASGFRFCHAVYSQCLQFLLFLRLHKQQKQVKSQNYRICNWTTNVTPLQMLIMKSHCTGSTAYFHISFTCTRVDEYEYCSCSHSEGTLCLISNKLLHKIWRILVQWILVKVCEHLYREPTVKRTLCSIPKFV